MPVVDSKTFVDELIAEQRSLSAVERFARKHDRHEIPALAKHYRSLIPAGRPESGKQYAFEVDLDQCSGCKACVTACHSLNGLDENESWRSVGLLIGTDSLEAARQFVTTACHHCADPACLNGCPVLAYDKDPNTGIVRHLDDQCIGCQYCVLKCPYEVPRYSPARGIVRKCDMCSQRLQANEAPACVQACPNEAIRITTVSVAAMAAAIPAGSSLVPGAPDSAITFPTTRYLSSAPSKAKMKPAAARQPRLQPAHWPLAWMLVLTQIAAGMFTCTAAALLLFTQLPGSFVRSSITAGFGFLTIGMIASVFHLGRPLQAWRAFLGWRKSWLSREVIALGMFAGAASLLVLVSWMGSSAAIVPRIDLLLHPAFNVSLWIGTVTAAWLAAFSSAMVYVDTRREAWGPRITFPRFFGSAILLGLSGSACAAAFAPQSLSLPGHVFGEFPRVFSGLLPAAALLKLAWEAAFILKPPAGAARESASLLIRQCPNTAALRFALGITGGIILPAAVIASTSPNAAWLALAGFTSLAAGELLERHLFFKTVSFPKMPGEIA